MNKNNLIDKQIYSLSPDIGKRIVPIYSFYICTFIGCISAAIYFTVGDNVRNRTLSELLAVTMGIGAIALVTTLCYHLFGDCHRPYYKPDGSPIERKERFYDNEYSDRLIQVVNSGASEELDHIPTNIQPNIVVISYCDAERHFFAMQAFDNRTGTLSPITDIFINQKKS